MTDRSQMMQSPAYAALSPAGRKVLAAIEREVERGGGVVVISFADFARRCDVSHSAAYSGLKQVALLGFASVETGPRPRRIHTIRLRDNWQGIDADEARRLARERMPIEEYAQTLPNLTAVTSNLFDLISARQLVLYPDAEMRLSISRAIIVESARGWRLDKMKQNAQDRHHRCAVDGVPRRGA